MTTSTRARVSRRRLLQGIGGAALALPFLQRIPSAHAEPIRRLVVFFTPNEWMDRDHWASGPEGSDMELPEMLPTILKPLQAHRDKLCLVGDLAYPWNKLEHNGGHSGSGPLLTGTANVYYGADEEAFWAGGVSVDQFLAQETGTESLVLGALPDSFGFGPNGKTRISYTGKNEPVAPQPDPRVAFHDLFDALDLPAAEQEALRNRRKMVLDTAAASLGRVTPKLPIEDAHKLEQHLDQLMALRAQLDAPIVSCSATAMDEAFDPYSITDYPTTIKRHIDVATQALACDVRRIAVIQVNNTTSNGIDPSAFGLPIDVSSHTLSHAYNKGPNDQDTREKRELLESFYTEQFAYLLDQLQSTQDIGGASLLDSTLVVYVKPMGHLHDSEQMLAILAGAAGAIPWGRFKSVSGASNNDLLTSICHIMGSTEVGSFGEAGMGKGPLDLG